MAKANKPSLLIENLQESPSETTMTLQDDGSLIIELPEEMDEFDAYNASQTDETYVEEQQSGHYRNLVKEICDTTTGEETLQRLAKQVLESVDADEDSRWDYMKDIELGLSLLGIKIEEKHEPFDGACSAQHPLLMESAVKFQSKASAELLPSDGPVKTKVLGSLTEEKEDQANRVKKHMNWQITEQMTEYYVDSEKMLLHVPIIGSAFKKTYYDGSLERPVSELVPMDQFVVPNSSSDLDRAIRYTHILYKAEDSFKTDCASGFYHVPEDFDFTPAPFELTAIQEKLNQIQGMEVAVDTASGGFTLYEHYCNAYIPELEEAEGDIKKYEIGLPYIITVDYVSQKVVGIRRNWSPTDTKRKRKRNFTHFSFVPGFGFYGLGFIHLLGNLQLTLTSALRSLVDAGQFANLQGGFKLKGVRIVDDGTPISPGQFKEIDAGITDISKAIFPLPFKGADQTLFAMLQFLTSAGQKFADATENVIADSTNYGPVGTTMALLDASTKFFGAVHKRLHLAQKQELKIIAQINSETLPDNYEYNIENETVAVTRDDYDTSSVDVVPVSDPNISSNAHRMAKAQTLFQFATQTPEVFDMRQVVKHVLINMDYGNIDKIIPEPDEAVNQDPMSDLQSAINGKPIKAFEGQDHDSHIQIKMAFLQNPNAGGSQIMQKAAMSIEANIQEHMLLKFMSQTQAQAANMAQQSQIPPEQALTAAAQQVAQLNQQEFEAKMEEANANSAEKQQAEANHILAQAELQSAQNDANKIKVDEELKNKELDMKLLALQLESMKELNKLYAIDKKAAHDLKKVMVQQGMMAVTKSLEEKPKMPPTTK